MVTIGCAIMVSSYILFEVLDLDGSNWPLAQYPGSGNVLVATEPIEIKPTALAGPLDRCALAYDDCSLQQKAAAYLFVLNETRISGLRSPRCLFHRAALPRSSIPDPSPLA